MKNEVNDETDIISSIILKVKINNKEINEKKYSPLLIYIIELINKEKNINVKDLIDKTKFNYKIGEYTYNGFHYKEHIGISIQYKDSYSTFKAIEILAKTYEYSLILKLKTNTSKIVKYEF